MRARSESSDMPKRVRGGDSVRIPGLPPRFSPREVSQQNNLKKSECWGRGAHFDDVHFALYCDFEQVNM